MDNKILLSPIDLNLFMDSFRSVIRDEIKASQLQELDTKLLNAVEVCKLFSISRVTLIKWCKEGKIPEHRIGGTVRYKYAEIMESLKTLSKYKKV